MSVIVVNRRGDTHNVLAQSKIGAAPNVYRLVGVVQDQATLTFQANLAVDAELIAKENGYTTPLSEEQIQLLAQYDWGVAPSWASFAAINADGSGAWFSEKPTLDEVRGKWGFSYGEHRTWPMYSSVKAFRGWRCSLVERPTGGVPEPLLTPTLVCPGVEGQVFTDAISYIEAGLGNMQVVPPCEYVLQDNSPQIVEPVDETPLSATVIVEVSNDAITWITAATIQLSEDSVSVGASVPATWPYIRAKLVVISGKNAFVTVSMSV